MADMLVNLLKLPEADMSVAEVMIRRAQPYEISQVRSFISANFSAKWADEVSVGFSHQPISIFIATRDGHIVGFAAYECTRRAFFGPTGVLEEYRGQGVGTALLIAALNGLKELGYVYGIIGGVGPAEFYASTVGAIVIPDSEPGIYFDPLKSER